jgi:hypothetical protein
MTVLGWVIWKKLKVVVNLPQSTFTPASYCTLLNGGKISPALVKVAPTVVPCCSPWMKLP